MIFTLFQNNFVVIFFLFPKRMSWPTFYRQDANTLHLHRISLSTFKFIDKIVFISTNQLYAKAIYSILSFVFSLALIDM